MLASCGGENFQDRPSLVPSNVTPTPLPAPLTVDNEDFQIEFGPEWKMEREGESYIFNDVKELRQITIAALRPIGAPTGAKIEELGREAILIRQEVLKELSEGKVTFSDIRSDKVRDGYDLRFSATDPLNGVKIRFTTFARPQRVVTVSFNKYSPFPSDEELDRQSASILARIKVKN
jgi:hypothetical protein